MSGGNAPRETSATPLERKLGLVTAKGGVGDVSILGEPEGFRILLGDLPDTVRLHPRLRETTRLALCFARSHSELTSLIELLGSQLPREAHVWIIHPKAQHKPDFNQNHVRDEGLAAGLVDYKVCSVDADWSGLKFAWRKA
jgi:hypothetical protein